MAGWWERLGFGGREMKRYREDGPLERDWSAHEAEVLREREQHVRQEAAITEISSEEKLAQVVSERDRLKVRITALEAILADPEKGQNAILYFRLRAIWSMCHRDLQVLSRQFREKYASEPWAAAPVDAGVQAVEAEAGELRKEVARLHYELHERERPFRKGEQGMLRSVLIETKLRLAETEARLGHLRRESAPDVAAPQGGELSCNTRRAINTLLIALAQHFYLLYREDQIAEAALNAARKPVEEAYFGLAEECLRIEYKVRELIAAAGREEKRHEMVRRRAAYLYTRLRYADAASAIPVAESLSTLPTRVGATDEPLSSYGEMLPMNILTRDYWDLSRTLLP